MTSLPNRKTLLRAATATTAVFGLAVGLGACSASSGDAGYHPQSVPAEAKGAEVTVVPAVAPTTPAQMPDVSGLLGQRLVTPDGIAARWTYLPGDEEFNRQLAEAVKAKVLDFSAAIGVDYKPQGMPVGSNLQERGCVSGSSYLEADKILADPALSAASGDQKLSVACDVFYASGPVLAQRLRFVTADGGGAVTGDETREFYTDLESGAAADTKGLLKVDDPAELYRTFWHFAVEEKYVDEKDSPVTDGDTDTTISDDLMQALLNDVQAVQFTDSGDVLVTAGTDYFRAFNSESEAEATQSAAQAAGQDANDTLTIKIPLEIASPYLSDLGVKVAQSYATPTAWAGTPAVPPGNVYTDCSLTPCVAVTFDDGPGPQTPEVLDILAKNQSAATFFLLGIQVQQYPDSVKKELEGGNELGNHTWDHKDLTTLNADQVHQEVEDTNKAIEDASGQRPTVLRPPYGAWNEQALTVAGIPAILWSIDTEDWKIPGTEKLIASAVDPAVAGDIILMHDIHPETVAAVPQIIEGLRGRGFVLTTISNLFKGDPPSDDVYYRQYY